MKLYKVLLVVAACGILVSSAVAGDNDSRLTQLLKDGYHLDRPMSFKLPAGPAYRACDHEVCLIDTYGDGWGGGTIDVLVNGSPVLTGLTITYGTGPECYTFQAEPGDAISTVYANPNAYPYENLWIIYGAGGVEVCQGEGGTPTECIGTGDCSCVGSEPAEDECTAVTPVLLADGVPHTYTGDITCATSDCADDGTPEGWVAFTLPASATGWNVVLDYCGSSPAWANGYAIFYAECPCTTRLYWDGFDGTTCGDGNFTLWSTLPAGTYYYPMMQDPGSGAGGPYQVNVVADEIVISAGDSCGDPYTMTFPADLPYATTDTTCGRGNNESDGDCLGYYDGGEDIFYEMTLTEETCMNFILTSDTTYTGIAIDANCPAQLATCIESTNSSTGEELLGVTLAAGVYMIQIDTWPSPDCINSFDLVIEECPQGGACCHGDGTCDDVAGAGACADLYMGDGTSCATVMCPVPNDTCAGATPVTCGYSGTETIDGAANDYDPTSAGCTTYAALGPDTVYSFVGTGQQITIDMDSTTSGFDASLYVVTDCSDVFTYCVVGDDAYPGPEQVVFDSVTGVTYYIITDKYGSTIPGDGSFEFAVSCLTLEGACCEVDDCTITTEAACAGAFMGNGTVCGVDDCDGDGSPDACEFFMGAEDCQPDGIPDECQLAGNDCQPDGIPDDCQLEAAGGGVTTEPFDDCGVGSLPGDYTVVDVVNTIASTWGCTTTACPAAAPTPGGLVLYTFDLGERDVWLVGPSVTMTSGSISIDSQGCASGTQVWCDNYTTEIWLVVGTVGGGDDIYVGELNSSWTEYFGECTTVNFDVTGLVPAGPFSFAIRHWAPAGDDDSSVIDNIVITDTTPGADYDCDDNGIPDECECGDGAVLACAGEECDGSECCDADCTFSAAATDCGGAPSGDCDAQNTCDGAGTCDDNYAGAGTACGDPANTACDDPDSCDGAGACLPNYATTAVICRGDAGDCDVPDYCDGAGACDPDAFEPAGTACGDGADTDCDNPDTCDGGGACLDNFEAVGFACTPDDDVCTYDVCDGGGACDHLADFGGLHPACGACCYGTAGICEGDTYAPGPCPAEDPACALHDQCFGGFASGEICDNVDCEKIIVPAVTEWGLLVLALLLVAGIAVKFSRREVC